MTGADALVAILKAEGVQQAFCYPTTPILEALARGGVRTLLARQSASPATWPTALPARPADANWAC